MKLEFLASAGDELAEIAQWYRSKAEGLDRRFLTQLAIVLSRVVEYPHSHAVVHESFRRALVGRFPYAVLFIIDVDTVLVVAIEHTSRDPERPWRDG